MDNYDDLARERNQLVDTLREAKKLRNTVVERMTEQKLVVVRAKIAECVKKFNIDGNSK